MTRFTTDLLRESAAAPLPRRSMAQPPTSDPDDAGLLARLRRDDTGALDELLARYWYPLVAYLLRFVPTRDAAEDIAQRAFYRLWEHRRQWRPAGSPRGLLYRVAHNLAISERRSSEAHARASTAFGGQPRANPTPCDLLERAQLRDALEGAIQALPERRRQVFVLRCIHELSYKEIADIMGTSQQTVANQLSHALATLRQSLTHLIER